MNLLDWVMVVFVMVSVAFGIWRGLVTEMLSLMALALAAVLAWRFGADFEFLIPDAVHWTLVRQALAGVALFIAVLVFGTWITQLVKHLVQTVGLGGVDRLLGAGFGMVRALLILLLVMVYAGGLLHQWEPIAPAMKQSRLIPVLERAAHELRVYFDLREMLLVPKKLQPFVTVVPRPGMEASLCAA